MGFMSYGQKHISASVRKITRPVFKKFGFSNADLILRWDDVVGPQLSRLSHPMRLIGPRGQADGLAVLVLRVGGAAALEIQHQIPQILERINTFYGYRAVGEIRLEQGPLPKLGKTRPRRLKHLSDSEEKELKASLQSIRDPDLRTKLEKLGTYVKTNRNTGPRRS